MLLRALRHALRVVLGILLLVVGLAGLILPVLPGWPFIAAAVVLLGPRTRLARHIVDLSKRLKNRFLPKAAQPDANP
jgi:uncharacterized membrane protein YbaN (DUF454 family)